jgi:hypothetical protein
MLQMHRRLSDFILALGLRPLIARRNGVREDFHSFVLPLPKFSGKRPLLEAFFRGKVLIEQNSSEFITKNQIKTNCLILWLLQNISGTAVPRAVGKTATIAQDLKKLAE